MSLNQPAEHSALVPIGVPAAAAASASSLVHTLETNQQRAGVYIKTVSYGSCEHDIQAATKEEQHFRHSGWCSRRAQIWKAFASSGIGSKRCESFANCGSGLWLQRDEAGTDLHLSCNKCHDRWCIPCQNDRASLIREKICQHMSGRTVRFLTLTLRHSNTPLRDQIARLYRSFSNFRRRESWKRHVHGGVAFFETKIAESDGLWHCHLHILIEGSFWEIREICREWHCVTGDSSICHLKATDSSEQMASYVTKYVTKPADASVFAIPDKLSELIISLKGTRLALPFGTWRHLKLMEKPAVDVKWISISSIETLKASAASGDPDALRWLEAASRRWPLFSQSFFPDDTS